MKLLKKLLSNLFIGILFVSFVIIFVVFKNWQTEPYIDHQTALMSQIKTHNSNEIIQIEVLNGCGDKGIADLYATFLRENDYDVIDYKNAENFNYNSSKIIVHNNNLYVEDVANLFQIDSKNIDYHFDDDNIIHDITIIVGKDYKSLESYSDVRKSYMPY